MCERIVTFAEIWPSTKSNRWLGFVQGAMLANRLVDFAELKSMFDSAKAIYPEFSEDFVDHLDPHRPFNLEIDGEG